MFAGHIGAALALGRIERGMNVGTLITAALLPDILLWLLVLVGWESVRIPVNFTSTHQPQFDFPFSHGLLATLAWSCLAGLLVLAIYTHLEARLRAAGLVALAVLSHWILDALVHRPELPLTGPGSRTIGLALWDRMSLALALETGIVIAGLCLYLPAARTGRLKSTLLAVLTLVVTVFTIFGMTRAPAPPTATVMAASSLVTIIVVCALGCWFGNLPHASRQAKG